MQRADRSTVELVERGAAAVGLARLGRGDFFEALTDAVAELGAGLLGEGDGGDVAQLDAVMVDVGGHERDDAVDER